MVFTRARLDGGQRAFARLAERLLVDYDSHAERERVAYRDDALLEPLLFAFFTRAELVGDFEHVMLAYREPSADVVTCEVTSDTDGIVTVPRLAYLRTGRPGTPMVLSAQGPERVLSLRTADGAPVAFETTPTACIGDSGIELDRHCHPLLASVLAAHGCRGPGRTAELVRRHAQHLELALDIVLDWNAMYYELLCAATRSVVLFEADGVNSFATQTAHGTAFLNVPAGADEVFFTEDLIHQCGHIMFGAMTFDPQELFAVDWSAPLREVTGDPSEQRSVYATLHGIVTERFMTECLEWCLDDGRFSVRQRHEILGRLAFIFQRFAGDLSTLSDRRIFTSLGYELYTEIADSFHAVSARLEEPLTRIYLGDQPYNFDYPAFRARYPCPAE